MIIAALLVLGVSWFAVRALSRTAVASYEREVITARSLQMAKDALLSYVAHYAARTTHNYPGRMPCPESLTAIGTANEGEAPGACSNTLVEVGRLPWKTIGMEPLTDGDGERLWYVLGPNFHPVAFPPATPLNFNTPAALPFDGTNVVALIIAPGKPLNTLADSGTPPAGCAKVAQGAARYASPLDPARFFECGNATGAYASLGQSSWTNDRAIAITQAEWVNAIAGGVAERLQRQVAPALAEWRTANGWGADFLPYASTFSNPATNDRCGDIPGNNTANGVRDGLLPTIGSATIGCSGWASGNVGALLLNLWFPAPDCTPNATEMVCTFSGISFLFGTNLFSARVTATAPNVAASFRKPIAAGDIQVAPAAGTNISNFTLAVSPATGQATVQFDVSRNLGLFTIANFTVRIPHLPDADLLADARMTWFLANQWDRHTYYAVAPSSTLNAAPVACAALNDPGCIQVRGLDPASGNYWDKRLVLALAGPALAGQDRTGAPGALANYLEEHNATEGDGVFRARFQTMSPDPATEAPTVLPPYPAFNDRLAACPFRATKDGAVTDLCP